MVSSLEKIESQFFIEKLTLNWNFFSFKNVHASGLLWTWNMFPLGITSLYNFHRMQHHAFWPSALYVRPLLMVKSPPEPLKNIKKDYFHCSSLCFWGDSGRILSSTSERNTKVPALLRLRHVAQAAFFCYWFSDFFPLRFFNLLLSLCSFSCVNSLSVTQAL